MSWALGNAIRLTADRCSRDMHASGAHLSRTRESAPPAQTFNRCALGFRAFNFPSSLFPLCVLGALLLGFARTRQVAPPGSISTQSLLNPFGIIRRQLKSDKPPPPASSP